MGGPGHPRMAWVRDWHRTVCQVSSRTGIRRWELITADYGPDINRLEQVFAVPRPGSIVAAVKTGEGRLFVFEEVFGGGLRVNVF